MKYDFNVTGSERKNLVHAISTILDIPSEYAGVPSAAYHIGELVVDRDGSLIFPDDYDPQFIDDLLFDLENEFNLVADTVNDEDDVPVPYDSDGSDMSHQTDGDYDRYEGEGFSDEDSAPYYYADEEAEEEEAEDEDYDDDDEDDDDSDTIEPDSFLHQSVHPQDEDLPDTADDSLSSEPEASERSHDSDSLTNHEDTDSFEDASTDDAGENEATEGTEESVSPGDEPTSITLALPLKQFTPAAIERLRAIVASKQSLLKKALATDTLDIIPVDDKLTFPWFHSQGLEGEIKAYSQLVFAISKRAITCSRTNAAEKPYDDERLAMRLFLVRLEFIGDEYKQSRKVLMHNLESPQSARSRTATTRDFSLDAPTLFES